MTNPTLVTGATGFLGSYLARVLIARGYPVRALKRKNSDTSLLGQDESRVEWIEGDILDPFALEEAMQGVHTVYHSAAVVSFRKRDQARMIMTNRDGTANVVNAALESGVRHLLHVSSVAALGRTKAQAGGELDEEAEWEQGGNNTPYALSKYLAEREAWRGEAEGLQVAMINPGTIFGGGFWDRGTARFFSRAVEGIRFYTSGITGFVDVRDVAEMSVDLIEGACFGKRYIAVGENLPYREIFRLICKELSVAEPGIEAGPFLLGLAWRWEALKALLTGGSADITKSTARVLQSDYRYNNSLIREATSRPFRSIGDTLRETAAVYLEAVTDSRNHGILPLK